MNLVEKFGRFLKISAITIVLSLLLFSQRAIAFIGISDVDRMFDVSITAKEFSINVPNIGVANNLKVGSRIVSLPEKEIGAIDKIVIIRDC